MSGFQQLKQNNPVVEKAYNPQTFTEEQMADWLEESIKAPLLESSVCGVMYGWDGTAKSGCAMDCRNKEQVDAEKKVIIMDLDDSALPLKKYHGNDKNIIVLEPLVLLTEPDEKQNIVDFVSSYNKALAMVQYVFNHEKELNMQAFVIDGLDTLLKWCEYVMRYSDLKKNPDAQITDSWQWSKRNRRYLNILMLAKRLHCDRLFTTHFKEVKQYVNKQLQTIGRNPDWEKTTPGIMFQRIEMTRPDQDPLSGGDKSNYNGPVEIEAIVHKAKGALHLEGSRWTVAVVDKEKKRTEWNGLQPLFEEFRKIPAGKVI